MVPGFTVLQSMCAAVPQAYDDALAISALTDKLGAVLHSNRAHAHLLLGRCAVGGHTQATATAGATRFGGQVKTPLPKACQSHTLSLCRAECVHHTFHTSSNART